MVLLPFVPRHDARHGGRTTAALVARLAQRHDVALLYLRPPGEDPVDPLLVERCSLVVEVGLPSSPAFARAARLLWGLARLRPIEVTESASRELGRRVRDVSRDFQPEVVHLEMERMAQYQAVLAYPSAACVLVAMEAAGQTARDVQRNARGADRLLRWLDLTAWRRFEPAALRSVDEVVCYTPRDRTALEAAAPGVAVETIPLCVELPPAPLNASGSGDGAVLFVGGFGHLPNVEAAVRLATRIFPRVRARSPEAVLQLVGDKPPASVRRLAGDGVTVTGRVEDVAPYLDRAAVVVAPLRLGGGMRVKVLEALAAGKAVVASPLAAQGLTTRDGEQLLIADADEQFADAITRVLDDPGLRAALGRGARSWAEQALDWDEVVRSYEAVYRRAIGVRGGGSSASL